VDAWSQGGIYLRKRIYEPNIRFPDIWATDADPDEDEGDDEPETVGEAMARRFGGRLGSY